MEEFEMAISKTASINSEPEVVNIDLSSVRKKRFSINGDPNKILELNTSDLNIITRLNEAYPKLTKLAEKASKKLSEVETTSEEESIFEDGSAEKLSNALKEIDSDMREAVDFIFDANVSEVCADDGSMYDPFNGQFRYEHIIDVLSGLYEQNLTKEMKKMTARVKKHTSKYIK